MVEFCKQCKSSLPTGDMTIARGKLFTSHDYICPDCGKPANPAKGKQKKTIEPDPEADIVISKGEAKVD